MTDKKPFFGSATSKWMLAGVAVLTIGVGVSIADWAREGSGYGPRWSQSRSAGPGPGIGRLCERDPLKFEGVARAFLKADLDLTTTQNAELDKLAAGLVPALKELRDEVCNNFSVRGAATAPERLEKFASVLRKAADTAEKTVQPAKTFYSALDEKQKARVEELANRRPPHMRGGPGLRGEPGFDGPPPGPGWFR
jgi:hypothetical protein